MRWSKRVGPPDEPTLTAASAWARRRHEAALGQLPKLAWRARPALLLKARQGRVGRAYVQQLPVRSLLLPPTAGSHRILAGPLRESSAWSRPFMRPAGPRARVLLCPGTSVLDLPAEPGAYARGRSRQAMRTNANRARRAGYLVRPVAGAEAADLDDRLQRGWGYDRPGTRLPSLFGRPDQVELAAVDAAGVVRTVAIATVAGEYAHLDVFATAPSATEPAVDARYLLHLELVEVLHARGVRTVLCECALTVREGVQYQQRLLGFTPVTVQVAVAAA